MQGVEEMSGKLARLCAAVSALVVVAGVGPVGNAAHADGNQVSRYGRFSAHPLAMSVARQARQAAPTTGLVKEGPVRIEPGQVHAALERAAYQFWKLRVERGIPGDAKMDWDAAEGLFRRFTGCRTGQSLTAHMQKLGKVGGEQLSGFVRPFLGDLRPIRAPRTSD
jgi:hypothetical protein